MGQFVYGFHITQTHRTYLEADIVVVPAGQYGKGRIVRISR